MKGLKPIFNKTELTEKPILIAGPCSAESKERVISIARELHDLGIGFFRAGLWKPRTKPGSFEGVGARGMPWLSEVKTKFGMMPLTEIASPAHLRSALNFGMSSFWIGARTTTNPFAVQAIADELKKLGEDKISEITILVKNPVNPDVELWIGALERIYASGLKRIGAVHRGFSAYGENYYRNRPEWSIPLELKHRYPELPVICDPSHIAGRRDLILPLCQQAMDLNFDGLMIEVHAEPDFALSDGGQQITADDLKNILDKITLRRSGGEEKTLSVYREEIDTIDNELISLLARRMHVSKSIGELKKLRQIPVWQSQRYNELMSRHVQEAERLGLPDDFIRKILALIHEESVKTQLK